MASVLLKVGAGAHYEDGDIISAFNRRRIRCAHAERICLADARRRRKLANGLLDDDDVARDWCETVCQYRYERLSKAEAKVVRLSDGAEIRFESNTPFEGFRGKRVQMDIAEYIRRRMDAGKKLMFGEPGREIWYGGREDRSDDAMSAVWNRIESKTGLLESDHAQWPMGVLDLMHHLALPADDFDEATRSELEAPLVEQVGTDEETGEPIYETRAKRKHHISWPDLFPLDIPPTTGEADVRNREKSVDPRQRGKGAFRRADLVLEKSL